MGSPIGRLLLFVTTMIAATGKYTLSIVRLMRVLGTATAVALAGFVVVMLRREAKRPPLEDARERSRIEIHRGGARARLTAD